MSTNIDKETNQPRFGLSIQEVAFSLNCSERHVKKLLKDGVIPSFTIGSLRRVRPNDLQKALDERVQRGWVSEDSAAA